MLCRSQNPTQANDNTGESSCWKPHPHEHNYLIDHLDEIEAVIVDLSFNVQDDRWLVYCTACGHEHLDLPETDERISIGEPDPFHQAA